jgi:pilus assembly protein FimV
MFVHRRKLLSLYIAATLVSGHAAAVGLGDLSLQSYLGKPLQAEVALSHMGDLTVDQLKVQIGSEADYSALGVEYNYLHSRLKIEPFVKNGQNYVRITTSEAISEPYLDFVLNLRWPQGQVVREFTVLLDPAPNSGTALASRNEPMAINVSTGEHGIAAAVTPQAEPAVPESRPARSPRVQPLQRAAGGTYTTQRGDSLWRLASQLRPSAAVSVEQMMAALQAANPGAFINGDAARLKEAAIIDVAAAERIATGGAVPAATTAVASTVTDSGMGLAASQVSTPAASSASALETGQLAQENASLKAQVADLSQNVSNLNDSLAQSTERLHEMENRLDNLLQQFQQQRNPATNTEHAAIAQSSSMINQVNAAELAPAPKTHTPLWVHLMYWAGIAAAAGWAVREHFWPARRLALAGVATNSSGGNSSRIVERSSAERTAAPTGENTWGTPEQYWHHADSDAGLSLDLPDLAADAQHTTDIELDLPQHGDDPVDASISAGVFVAFGRFDEAERLLQEALLQDRDRIDLKLQLLDVYVQSNQTEAFESLAQAIEQGPATPETLAELAVLRDSFQARG